MSCDITRATIMTVLHLLNVFLGLALTLKAPRKNASENVVCCKSLPNFTDKLSIKANSVDPEQTAPIGAV